MLRLLLDAIFVLVLKETVKRYIPGFLKPLWFVIFWFITLEVINAFGRTKAIEVFHMANDKNMVPTSYVIVAALGAILSVIYWWTIGKSLTALASKEAEAPIEQQTPPKKPDIQQSSQGANSPNIVGNNNVVNIGDPKIAAKLDEITRLLKAQGERTAPEKLLAKYPLGYIIFDIDHENIVFPYQTHAFDNWDFDFTYVKVINSIADRVTIRMPDIYPKAGRSGPTIISPMITTPKKVGPFSVRYIFSDREIALTGEVLAVKDGSMVFILGFVPAPNR